MKNNKINFMSIIIKSKNFRFSLKASFKLFFLTFNGVKKIILQTDPYETWKELRNMCGKSFGEKIFNANEIKMVSRFLLKKSLICRKKNNKPVSLNVSKR